MVVRVRIWPWLTDFMDSLDNCYRKKVDGRLAGFLLHFARGRHWCHHTCVPVASSRLCLAANACVSDPPYVNTLEESTSPDDVLQVAIKRLESSGTSPNILEAVNGLRAMGYTLKLAETNVPGKRPENYLRIMDPKYTAHGIGYLTPKNFSFSRMSDRDRLAELPGATLVSSAVNFSHVKSAQPGLDTARLLKA
jgi:hypothetical protein